LKTKDELAKAPRDTEIVKYPLKIGKFPGVEEKARLKKGMMKDTTNS
jgi:hypothetical protein